MIRKANLLDYAARLKDKDKPRKIVARVAGVTFEGRQELLKKIKPDTPIRLERDRRNEHDFYAVKVLAEISGTWEHVGFLPSTMSKRVAKPLDDGLTLKSGVHKLKGGDVENDDGSISELNYGLDIYVEGQMK
jgi:hypothetical protein